MEQSGKVINTINYISSSLLVLMIISSFINLPIGIGVCVTLTIITSICISLNPIALMFVGYTSFGQIILLPILKLFYK